VGADHVVRLGDCLEGMRGLADKSVDHVICDPPFSDWVHKNFSTTGRRSDGAAERGDVGFAALSDEMAQAIAAECARVARRWLLFFCDEYALEFWRKAIRDSGAEYVRWGIWVKSDAQPQFSGDRPGTGGEHIAIGHAARDAGRTRWNGGGRSAVWRGPAQDPDCVREHPTQKPLWLMEALVRDFTDAGDLVIDPFAGSGTTGVACRRLGRRFLGWEMDPTHHATALRRIAAAREQMTLFDMAGGA
jgi:site-specific DNA-methyltransferase (adenine-specific)